MQSSASNWVTPNGNPTVKWNGTSILKLRESLSTIREIAYARTVVTSALNAQIAAAEEIAKCEVGRLLDVPSQDISLGTHWECPESPTLHCIYNTREDPDRDQCLICGEPAERK